MKNIVKLILILLLFAACEEKKYTYLGQRIIEGKVSAVDTRHSPYFIWVQNSTETVRITIPYGYRNKRKVGDSCVVIIEKYKENESK